MNIIRTNELKENLNNTVQLNGWVYNSRCSGKIGFLMFRDGFSLIQCIISVNDVGEDKFNEFKTYTQESSIKVVGKVVENDRAPGGYEVLIQDIELYHLSVDYPITPKNH